MKEYQIHIDCILIIIFKLISEYTSGMIIHYSSRIERRRDLGGLCSHNTLCSAVQVDININKLIFPLMITINICSHNMLCSALQVVSISNISMIK